MCSEFSWLVYLFSLQTYYLMQSPETKALGDAVGFGSAFLFASVFGMFFTIPCFRSCFHKTRI
jgi:hypothetical protein